MIYILVISIIVSYMMFSGVMWGIGRHLKWDFDETPGPFLAVVFWPLALPVVFTRTLTLKFLGGRVLPKAKVVTK